MTMVQEQTPSGYVTIQMLLKEGGQVDYLMAVFAHLFTDYLLRH